MLYVLNSLCLMHWGYAPSLANCLIEADKRTNCFCQKNVREVLSSSFYDSAHIHLRLLSLKRPSPSSLPPLSLPLLLMTRGQQRSGSPALLHNWISFDHGLPSLEVFSVCVTSPSSLVATCVAHQVNMTKALWRKTLLSKACSVPAAVWRPVHQSWWYFNELVTEPSKI